MKCSETESRIQDLLDSRRNPSADPALQSHLDDCSTCRRIAEDYTLLLQVDFDSLMSLASPNSISRADAHGRRGVFHRWSQIGKVVCAIVAVFVIFVQPIIWSYYEYSRPTIAAVVKSTRHESAGLQQSATSRTMFVSGNKSMDSEESGSGDQLSVASLLDVSKTLNAFDFAYIAPQQLIAVEPIPADSTISRMIKSLSDWSEQNEMKMDAEEVPIENDQQRLQSLIDTCRQLFS